MVSQEALSELAEAVAEQAAKKTQLTMQQANFKRTLREYAGETVYADKLDDPAVLKILASACDGALETMWKLDSVKDAQALCSEVRGVMTTIAAGSSLQTAYPSASLFLGRPPSLTYRQ